jgi:hypothetical protein
MLSDETRFASGRVEGSLFSYHLRGSAAQVIGTIGLYYAVAGEMLITNGSAMCQEVTA